MKRLALILSTIAFVSLLIGCHDLNNPVDPEAASYQGFYTVADPAEVGPDTPSSGESSNYQVFYASKIVGGGPAETYHFTIWDEESTVVLDDDAVAGNILARDLGLSEGSYSWTAAITGKDGRGETVEFFTRGITADAAFDDGIDRKSVV